MQNSSSKDETVVGFPSFTVSKEDKSEDWYGLKWAQAIWTQHLQNIGVYNDARERIILCRQYAEGLEQINKYKDRLDLNGDTSYLNLDFSPVNRIATIVDNVVGRMMNQNYKIQCNPIDPESRTKFDQHRKEMYANMFLQQYSQQVEQKIGVPLVPRGTKVPESNEEAELELKLKYKPAASIAMEKAIQFVMMNNDSEEVRRKILKDLVSIKRAATLRYYDENYNIKYEYVDPADLITPYSKFEDFKNIPYVGVLKQYTINEIAEMNPGFTEDQLFDIAKTSAGKYNNPSWNFSNSYEGYYNTLGNTRPYNNFNCQVLEFWFLTLNKEVRVKKKNSKGSFFFEKKNSNYTGEVSPSSVDVAENDTTWKSKDGMEVGKAVAKTKEDAQIHFAKIKTEARNKVAETITKEIQYRYEGKWIVGTEYLYNYKMSENIDRENISGSYSPKTELPVVIIYPGIYDMQNKSWVERLIPHEDQINLIKLKSQQLLIKAKPPGVAIDLEGMDSIVMGMGKSENAQMNGIEITRMYEQTGSYTFRSRDKNGNVINSSVITQLENGIGKDFAVLFAAYNQELQMMNDVIGYNAAVDASSPDAKGGLGVNKMAIQATNNAMRPMFQAANNLILRQVKRLSLMIQDSIQFNHEAFAEAIGNYSSETIEYGSALAFNQFAIDITLLPDEDEKQQIEGLITLGIEQGLLTPSDILRVRNVLKENVKEAGELLVLLEDKNRKNKMEESAALQEQNGQIQQQSAQIASQMKQQELQLEVQTKSQLFQAEYTVKDQFEQKQFERAMALQKLKNEGTATVAEIAVGGKVDVQDAANKGKIITQQVANAGTIEKVHVEHESKLKHSAFENAIEKETAGEK